MPKVFFCLTFLFFISCQVQEPASIAVVFDYGESLQLNDIKQFDNQLVIAGGDNWSSGTVFFIDPNAVQKENETIHKHSFFDLAIRDEMIFGIGMENKLHVGDQNTWSSIKLDSNFVSRSIVVTDDEIITVGGVAYFFGHIQITDKTTYQVLKTINFDRQINAISVLKDSIIIAAGYGGIYTSFDKGNTWALNDILGDVFNAIYCDQEACYILGQSGLLYKTTDGTAFEKLKKKATSISGFRDGLTLKDGRMIVFGDNGLFELSLDNGQTWERLDVSMDSDILSAIEFDDKIYVSSNDGKIIEIVL